jgi:hypothetical protein
MAVVVVRDRKDTTKLVDRARQRGPKRLSYGEPPLRLGRSSCSGKTCWVDIGGGAPLAGSGERQVASW